MSGPDAPEEAASGVVVPCASRTDGRDEIYGVGPFCGEALPDFQGNVFAGSALPELPTVARRDGGERYPARPKDLQAVEDRRRQVHTGGAFIG